MKRKGSNPSDPPTASRDQLSGTLRCIEIDTEVFDVATGTLEIAGTKRQRASFRAEGSLVHLEAFLRGENPSRNTILVRFRRRALAVSDPGSGMGEERPVGTPRGQDWFALADLPNFLSVGALRRPREMFLRYASAHGQGGVAERIAEDVPEMINRSASDLKALRGGMLEAAAMTFPSRDDRFNFSRMARSRVSSLTRGTAGDDDLANIAAAISRAFDWLRIAAEQPLEKFMEEACLRFYETSGIFGENPEPAESPWPGESADRAAWASRTVSRCAVKELANYAVNGDIRVFEELAQGSPSVWRWPWVMQSLEALRWVASDQQANPSSRRVARSLLEVASTLSPLPRGRPRSGSHDLAAEALPLVKAFMTQLRAGGRGDIRPDPRLSECGITSEMIRSALSSQVRGRGVVAPAEELVASHFGFASTYALKRAIERRRKSQRETGTR